MIEIGQQLKSICRWKQTKIRNRFFNRINNSSILSSFLDGKFEYGIWVPKKAPQPPCDQP